MYCPQWDEKVAGAPETILVRPGDASRNADSLHKMAGRPLRASPAPPGRPLSHFMIYCAQWDETVAGVPGVP